MTGDAFVGGDTEEKQDAVAICIAAVGDLMGAGPAVNFADEVGDFQEGSPMGKDIIFEQVFYFFYICPRRPTFLGTPQEKKGHTPTLASSRATALLRGASNDVSCFYQRNPPSPARAVPTPPCIHTPFHPPPTPPTNCTTAHTAKSSIQDLRYLL